MRATASLKISMIFAFLENNMPWRSGCSDVLYHNPAIRLNPVEIPALPAPRNNLVTVSLAKLEVAAWQARTIDQIYYPPGTPKLELSAVDPTDEEFTREQTCMPREEI
jgi:hypothetical protein